MTFNLCKKDKKIVFTILVIATIFLAISLNLEIAIAYLNSMNWLIDNFTFRNVIVSIANIIEKIIKK